MIQPEEFFANIRKENPNFDLDLIKLAFEFAAKAHQGQKRLSGEDYIYHPLAVANRLALAHLDQSTVMAGLLHDIPEDTNITIEDIKKEFNKEVATLVNGITKLGKLKYRGIDRYSENLRKMFVAMAEDIRVVFIKFADRLHNLETLSALPAVKQLRIATETLEIYAPIANRLGMGAWRGELEDKAFPFVYPEEYQWLVSATGKLMDKYKSTIDSLHSVVENLLTKEGITVVEIQSRVKHLFSLWKKLQRPEYERDISRIHDLVALRIIVQTVSDCYHVLGAVHARFKPLDNRFKDYIAQPKPNGYQSLHTSVFTDSGTLAEIQIRTPTMHSHAEYGVAAHFHYDEAIKSKKSNYTELPEDKVAWTKKLAEWQKEFTDTNEFLDSLKLDIFKNRIFVFTPRGDVIDLPEDATPVDFAYHIHTQVGHQCTGVRINNQLKPLDSQLKNGDMIEILIDKNKKGPTEDWLKIVKTHPAREHIKSYFNKQRRSLIGRLFAKKE